MKTIKIFIALGIACLFIYASCTDNLNESSDSKKNYSVKSSTTEVSKLIVEDGKSYIAVDGQPFPFLGAQIRLDAFLNCDKMTIDQVEKYFVKAKDLGVNCIQIPIAWNMIEPQKDNFDFSIVDQMLKYANKYDLKVELLWFSTNMIGDSFSFLVPQYILQNYNKRLSRNDEGWFWNYYGYQYLMILDDEWVLENEVRAVTSLFDHIRVWDLENGERHPVISAQIHNEPDGLIRWRLEQKDFKFRDGTPLSKERGWQMTLNALNTVGKAVKNSDYKVVTRTNLIGSTNGVDAYPEAPNAKPRDVFDLEGIDFISVDSYKDNIKNFKKEVAAYASIHGNYALVGENKGSYANTPSLILTAVALGSGYDIYDLATSKFFIDHTTVPDEIDHGVYTWNLEEKWYNDEWFTDKVRRTIKGLVAASVDVAKAKPENFAVFNVSDNMPLQQKHQRIQTTGVKINCQTSTRSVGFVIDMKTHLLVYSVYDTFYEFSNGTFGQAVSGHYDKKGNFIEGEITSLSATNGLNAKGGILYKIKYTSDGNLRSTTLENIGNNS